jgi:hypothetical protein
LTEVVPVLSPMVKVTDTGFVVPFLRLGRLPIEIALAALVLLADPQASPALSPCAISRNI